MIDREFDVRAYEEGYRAGKHDAQVEIERLRAALELQRRESVCGWAQWFELYIPDEEGDA